jgi:hypothetical protein
MNAQIQYSGPHISADVPWETRRHLQILYGKVANHTQAFGLVQQTIVKLKAGSSTTSISEIINASGGGSISAGIPVNNQSGVTSYDTVLGDNGALIVLSDASPISLFLTSQLPPFSCFVANQSTGTVTVTPASGTISYAGNPGSASMPLLGGYCAMVAFDGTNWWTWMLLPTTPTITTVTNEIIAGSGTSWTLAHAPGAGIVPIIAVMLGGFGGVLLFEGETPGFTISGEDITTTSSYSAGTLRALWYEY